MVSLLFLLGTDGHHLLLDGIFYSYRFIPIDQAWIHFGNENMLKFLIKAFNQAFIIAFQMSMPVVGILFLVDVALGIVARTVPQINIFVVGLPVKIVVGLIVLIIVMGMMMVALQQLFDFLIVSLRGLMQLIGGN
jgi:flagellar biosynthetic protein FliR